MCCEKCHGSGIASESMADEIARLEAANAELVDALRNLVRASKFGNSIDGRELTPTEVSCLNDADAALANAGKE